MTGEGLRMTFSVFSVIRNRNYLSINKEEIFVYTGECYLERNKIIDASSGISPLGPSKKVKAAIRKAVKNIRNYPGPELTRLIRLFSSKYGLSEKDILLANSRKELIYLVPAVFRPERVLVFGPAPEIFEDAASFSRAEVSYLNADEHSGFTADAGVIKQHLDGTDLLFIANPNLVTGRLTDKIKLRELLSFSVSANVRVVLDESLIEFAGEGSHCDDVLKTDNVIVLRTTANFYGLPGLELAYAVSSQKTLADMKSRGYWSINNLSVEAARTAFKDDAYKKLTKKYIYEEKKILMNVLRRQKGITCYDSDSNVILIKLDHQTDKIYKSLERAGFSFKHCEDIKGLGKSFLRFSVMKHEYNLKFLRILGSCL